MQELGSLGLKLAGNDEQKERYLPKLASRRVARRVRADRGRLGLRLRGDADRRRALDGDEYVLNGSKRFITNAGVANVYTVFAKTDPDRGPRRASRRSWSRPTRRASRSRGSSRRWASGARRPASSPSTTRASPAANLLGEEGEGFKIAMRILDRSRPGIAAQGLGIAQGATDYALEYAKSRETMGKPIAQHQLIAAKLADMETACEAARGLLYRFGQMIDEGVDGPS